MSDPTGIAPNRVARNLVCRFAAETRRGNSSTAPSLQSKPTASVVPTIVSWFAGNNRPRKRLICREYTDCPKKDPDWRNVRARVERRSKYSWRRRQTRPQSRSAAYRHRNRRGVKPMVLFVLNLTMIGLRWVLVRAQQFKTRLATLPNPATDFDFSTHFARER
jgi:hypothetical protein